MIGRELGSGWLLLSAMFGSGLFVMSGNAMAEDTIYVGDRICSSCHPSEYDSYRRHGHPWKLVHTAGKDPVNDLHIQYPWGQTLPALPANVTWADVEYIMRGSSGTGSFRFFGGNRGSGQFNGKQIDLTTGKPTGSGYSCGKCHTTGYTAYAASDPDPAHHQMGLPYITGVWALDGIQCEACHGAGPLMEKPSAEKCRECHTGDDQKNGVLTGRMQFDPAGALYGKTPAIGWLSANHSQADEFIHSPHKGTHCSLCHDSHKSVWHEDGGVKYAEDGVGNMCKHCHNKRVRGAMGEIGLECIECHMPEASMKGSGASHLFRISTAPLAAKNNTYTEDGKIWWNLDASGNASLTLDLTCNSANCHSNLSLEQLSNYAPTIHRSAGMLDLTVNGGDEFQRIKKTEVVSVDFSVETGSLKGMLADWWVICQGPKGWTYWDGKKWKAGLRPWRKSVALADVPPQNVLKAKLLPGYYTYWVCIYPKDGSENVASVPLYIYR